MKALRRDNPGTTPSTTSTTTADTTTSIKRSTVSAAQFKRWLDHLNDDSASYDTLLPVLDASFVERRKYMTAKHTPQELVDMLLGEYNFLFRPKLVHLCMWIATNANDFRACGIKGRDTVNLILFNCLFSCTQKLTWCTTKNSPQADPRTASSRKCRIFASA